MLNTRINLVIVTLAILASVLIVATVSAFDEPTQDEVNRIARKLYCPVCENTPLDVCPTVACQNWRDEIRTALMEGQTEEEILGEFAVKYGTSVLAVPPRKFSVVWLLPVLLLFISAAVLLPRLNIWKKEPAPKIPTARANADSTDVKDLYTEQFEKEYKEWNK